MAIIDTKLMGAGTDVGERQSWRDDHGDGDE